MTFAPTDYLIRFDGIDALITALDHSDAREQAAFYGGRVVRIANLSRARERAVVASGAHDRRAEMRAECERCYELMHRQAA